MTGQYLLLGLILSAIWLLPPSRPSSLHSISPLSTFTSGRPVVFEDAMDRGPATPAHRDGAVSQKGSTHPPQIPKPAEPEGRGAPRPRAEAGTTTTHPIAAFDFSQDQSRRSPKRTPRSHLFSARVAQACTFPIKAWSRVVDCAAHRGVARRPARYRRIGPRHSLSAMLARVLAGARGQRPTSLTIYAVTAVSGISVQKRNEALIILSPVTTD